MNAVLRTIESRRAPRDTVSFRVSIAQADGLSGRVLLVDISPFGFMARGGLPLGPGDRVTLRLPAFGACDAVIRWSIAGRMGGEFEDAIPVHDYVRMLAAAPHDRPSWNEM